MYFPRLESLRTDAGRTQQEIADVLCCRREVYRRYEKGDSELPVWALIKLACLYNVSADYVIGLTDNERPYWPAAERAGKPAAHF